MLVDLPVAPDFEIQRFRQGVDHRHANAVQAARHLVAVVVELAARVEHRQHDFRGRLAADVLVHGNATAVVDHCHRTVDVDGDVDLVAETRQRLVDRVVDHLVDEVMQSGWSGRPDVHRRPLADRFQTLENLDLVRAVVRLGTVSVAAGHSAFLTAGEILRRGIGRLWSAV